MNDIEEKVDNGSTKAVKKGISLDSGQEDKNIIVPIPCKDGHGMVVVLAERPKIIEKGDNRLPALSITYYHLEQKAVATIDFLIPDVEKPANVDEKLYKANIGKMKQILGSFVDLTADKFDGSNFDSYLEFVDTAIKDISDKTLKEPFEIKLVYDKKGYISYPTVGSFLSTVIKKRNLDWNPKYDRNTKPEKDDSASPLGSSEVAANASRFV